MKCFTLDREGIIASATGIPLGEEGRGRHFCVVPLPAGAAVWAEPPQEGRRGILAEVRVPGESRDEILLKVPDCSGFRGTSTSEVIAGATKVAAGYCAQGDAGRMGGGSVTLYRVADGGSVRVRASGRRIEWSEAVLVNIGGRVVMRVPAVEAERDAAYAALTGPAPAITPAEAAAAHELEVARQRRDGLLAEAATAAQKRAEEWRAEAARLEAEAWSLEDQVAAKREADAARARADRARSELGNNLGAAFARVGL